MKILHITAHMGGGAGKAISGMAVADAQNEQSIVLLEKPEKTDYIAFCESRGVKVYIAPDDDTLHSIIAQADVIVVNWWHHPLVYNVLNKMSALPTRVIMWSHVNGLHYPRLPYSFAKCFDACLFTSKASFQNTSWTAVEQSDIENCSTLVYGMGDFHPADFAFKTDYQIHGTIKIGYVGTLGYAKIHPDFAKWMKAVLDTQPQVEFEIAGDPSSELLDDVNKLGVSEKVHFLGFRSDVPKLLTGWDIFAYPLNPINFATTENALLEAMACGLPIVASDGVIEKTIVQDGENGLLASNATDFANKVEQLAGSEELRTQLGTAARESTIRKYDLNQNVLRFQTVAKNVMQNNKAPHRFCETIGNNPFEWMLLGCDEKDAAGLRMLAEYKTDGKNRDGYLAKAYAFDSIYKGKSKGSAEQFFKYYPNSEKLSRLTQIMKKSQERTQ